MPLLVTSHPVESLGPVLEPRLRASPHIVCASVVHPGVSSLALHKSSHATGVVDSDHILQLVSLRQESLYFKAFTSDVDGDSLELKNAVLTFFLTADSFHRCPKLGLSQVLPHTKVGHGAKNSASHTHRIDIEVPNGTLPPAAVYAVKTVFSRCNIQVVAYDFALSGIQELQPIALVLKHTSINGSSNTSALTLEPVVSLQASDELAELYEYLCLITINSSLLVHGSLDSYISTYEAPVGPSENSSYLSLSSVQNIHSALVRDIIASNWVVLSIATENGHTILYRTPKDNVIVWATT
ncbi:uncharacterized protein CANTADRAFT_20168 [Suhomyces tanzawaensis NRRL Y-17324]|uniref:Uncharacterized protein n=1 Tax=Suhomyces tanzawaensis NRRL Y-17324 TaxID=984487 RepID=A0A1E4SM73_9ASCO|nr:uncharacterized protein CANTADRAFT_20168 [Suhomyces tanzawaensis NRRL Y-17324]ODV80588.1 hypothetical protein CANTADRAFT_20168 [Suhomyces tanzawaensis NRRL Y-17324]